MFAGVEEHFVILVKVFVMVRDLGVARQEKQEVSHSKVTLKGGQSYFTFILYYSHSMLFSICVHGFLQVCKNFFCIFSSEQNYGTSNNICLFRVGSFCHANSTSHCPANHCCKNGVCKPNQICCNSPGDYFDIQYIPISVFYTERHKMEQHKFTEIHLRKKPFVSVKIISEIESDVCDPKEVSIAYGKNPVTGQLICSCTCDGSDPGKGLVNIVAGSKDQIANLKPTNHTVTVRPDGNAAINK
jgi:hypothetical protein